MSFPILIKIKNLYNKNKELYLSMSRNKKGGKKKTDKNTRCDCYTHNQAEHCYSEDK